MTSRFESSPGNRAALNELRSTSKPVCTIEAYRSERDGEIFLTVHVQMAPAFPELESVDQRVVLDAIADSIRNIQTGKLRPASDR